jgi:hypothetical protein
MTLARAEVVKGLVGVSQVQAVPGIRPIPFRGAAVKVA